MKLRKIIAATAATVMSLGMLSATAFAADNVYTVVEDGVTKLYVNLGGDYVSSTGVTPAISSMTSMGYYVTSLEVDLGYVGANVDTNAKLVNTKSNIYKVEGVSGSVIPVRFNLGTNITTVYTMGAIPTDANGAPTGGPQVIPVTGDAAKKLILGKLENSKYTYNINKEDGSLVTTGFGYVVRTSGTSYHGNVPVPTPAAGEIYTVTIVGDGYAYTFRLDGGNAAAATWNIRSATKNNENAMLYNIGTVTKSNIVLAFRSGNLALTNNGISMQITMQNADGSSISGVQYVTMEIPKFDIPSSAVLSQLPVALQAELARLRNGYTIVPGSEVIVDYKITSTMTDGSFKFALNKDMLSLMMIAGYAVPQGTGVSVPVYLVARDSKENIVGTSKFGIAIVTSDTVAPGVITPAQSAVELKVGETKSVDVSLSSDINRSTLKYVSSNPGIATATATSTGVAITGISKGLTTIVISAPDMGVGYISVNVTSGNSDVDTDFTKMYVTANSGLRMREKPVNGKIIKTFPFGTVVWAKDSTTAGWSYVKVEYKGVEYTGYMSVKYLSEYPN